MEILSGLTFDENCSRFPNLLTQEVSGKKLKAAKQKQK